MAENSKIEWTTHTFNPWRGCTKVSAGCANCYADQLSHRNPKTLGIWGPRGTRVVASYSAWKEPVKWNRLAGEIGERHRVFCASLADVFEGPDTMPADAWPKIEDARRRLFDLIYATPNLDWLLLTKRPANANAFIGGTSGAGLASFPETFPNVWLGTSVEDQAAADDRIPELLKLPAVVRFLSCEPLLGPVSLAQAQNVAGGVTAAHLVDWVIVGGESGPGARPFNVDWARSIIGQCKDAGVPVFVKQLGAKPVAADADTAAWGKAVPHIQYTGDGTGRFFIHLRDRKGGDMDEWPADLRVREFPALKQLTEDTR